MRLEESRAFSEIKHINYVHWQFVGLKVPIILRFKQNHWPLYNKPNFSALFLSSTYTPGWNVWGEWFLARNQGNHQNFDPSLIPKKLWPIFMGMKQKEKFSWKKKSKMAESKKLSFSKSPILKRILWKFCGLVSRIDWCEGFLYGSTYMLDRLSDVSSKTGKKWIFCVFCLFLSLRWTASRPYRLSHIIALQINQSYWPKDQSMKFSQKKL